MLNREEKGSEEMVSREEAAAQVRSLANMFGLMFYHFASLLVEKFGEERGKELVNEVVKRYGFDRGQRFREKAIEMGLEPVLENFKKVQDVPTLGWGGSTRETYCPFAEVWIEKGAEDLGKLYCEVDIWKYVPYDPRIRVKRVKSVLEGNERCVYEYKVEPE